MPAGLNLLPRKAFELVLSDGTIVPGQFGTWALSRFTQKRNIGLQQVGTLFEDPKVSDMVDFVLCAIEYREREDGKPPAFNDLKLCRWIDDYALDSGEDGVIMKLLQHAQGDAPATEKKNPAEQPGPTSSDTPVVQE